MNCKAENNKELSKYKSIKYSYNVLFIHYSDNPQVDIVGANLYDRFLKESYRNRNQRIPPRRVPRSRSIPSEDGLFEQTVTQMESLLVGTGVYKHDTDSQNENSVYHGHRDIEHEPHLAKPSRFVPDVLHGIQHIFEAERFSVT